MHTFRYTCSECNFSWGPYNKRQETLFMVEMHIWSTAHLNGIFTKHKYNGNFESEIEYKKLLRYYPDKKTFSIKRMEK
jgi:hypothetical protein